MLISAKETLSHVELLPVGDWLRNLEQCRERKDLTSTRCVYTHLHGNGLQALDVLGNHLVPAFAECGSIKDAYKAFHKLENHNEHSWTSLIQVCAEYGDCEDAFGLLQKMQDNGVAPSKFTYVSLLRVCARLKYEHRGRKLHTQIIFAGLEADEFLGNTLVDMYAKCGWLVDAQGVFDGLSVQSVVSWNALIAGYAGCGLGENALLCFEQMQHKGIVPNAITFLASLKACGSIQAFGKSQEIHAEVVKEGFEDDYFIGSTLLDVSAKCGFLPEAQELFDELPFHDVVSWTALMAAYVEHGYGEQALHLLDKMQVEGIAPNVVTYTCGLKSCSSIGALDRGYELHCEIIKEGLPMDFTIGGSLVDMYAKCGSLAEAEDVFYEIPSRDVVLWTALIAGFAESGYDEEAGKLLKQMQSEGVYPDAVTLVGTLKACANAGNLSLGRQIHAEIAKEGAEMDAFVVNKLVDIYAKCGSLLEAREVFDEQQVHDVITWSALIAGYTEHELDEEALECFADMQQEGVLPDEFTYVSILRACANLGALERGHEMFAKVVEEDLERDPFIGNILVTMYGKCGSQEEAQDVFNSLEFKDLVSWNALIEFTPTNEVLGCLRQMRHEGVAPDALTYVCCLKACKNDIDIGLEIHAEVVKGGFEADLLVGNSLVDMYIKCGMLSEVNALFSELPARDVVSWNTLITGFADQGLHEEALQCLQCMQADGFLLDVTTCSSSLNACSNLGAISQGLEIHAEVAKEGFDSIPMIGNALIDMYVECAWLAEAHEVFNTLLPAGDVISWNTLIKGYSEQENIEMAFLLYKQMQEQGHLPTSATFRSLLSAYGSLVALESVKRIASQIQKPGGIEGLEASLVTAVINAYSKCGRMVDAQQLSDTMSGRDLAGWNALITGYVRQGETDEAFRTFQQMTYDERVQPDGITFISLLNACCHGGFVEIGQSYYEIMSREYGIVPSIRHHTCMMDLLGRSGQLSEAARMLELLPFEDDLVPWSSMLGACRNWGNMELGKYAFEQAMALGENSSAAYILMADMCADLPVNTEINGIHIEGDFKSFGLEGLPSIKIDNFDSENAVAV